MFLLLVDWVLVDGHLGDGVAVLAQVLAPCNCNRGGGRSHGAKEFMGAHACSCLELREGSHEAERRRSHGAEGWECRV